MNYKKSICKQIMDLNYSLNRKIRLNNKLGAYTKTSIICCNTNKTDGLLVCSLNKLNGKHVLLSSLDETIIQGDCVYHLAYHKYPDVFFIDNELIVRCQI